MNEFEEAFVVTHQRLQAAAQGAAFAKKVLIEQYIHVHYPDVSREVTIMHNDLLSLDVCYSGIGRDLTRKISEEVAAYLQGLLDRKDVP